MSGIQKDTSVICPGQQNLMQKGDKHFLRVVFTVYWHDSMPSTEVFYVTEYPIHLNLSGVENLQNEMVEWLKSNGHANVVRVIYLGYSGFEMSDDDVAQAGWRVFHGPTPPTPPVVNIAPTWQANA